MSSDSTAELSNSKSSPLRAGDKFGRYKIEKELGQGGMGTVWLATDRKLSRRIALKVMKKGPDTPPNLIKRFESEAKTVAKIKHDNIVSVYDTGELEGMMYIALEYIPGIDVDKLIKQRERLPFKRSLSIIKQTTLALEYLHQAGIVHRDVKPSNLLIRKDGSVVLTDLGLARMLDEERETRITRAGFTVGTVDYMPPEQAKSSNKADIRSDIYSLGCTWYHMLTGNIPFDGDSLTSRLHQHAQSPIPNPQSANSKIPDEAVAVLHHMMAKKPAERYQTPTELLEDLNKISNASPALSMEVLSALAADDSEPEPQAASIPRAKPPRKRLDQVEDAKQQGISVSPLLIRNAIFVVLAVGVVGAALWSIRDLSNAIGVSEPEQVVENAPVESGVIDATANPLAPAAPLSTFEKNPNGVSSISDPGNTTTSDPLTPDAPVKSTVGRVEEQKLLPAWVHTIPTAEQPARGMSDSPSTITVGDGAGVTSDFATLNEAIAALPAEGGVIRLVAPGPYSMSPVTLNGPGAVTIVAEADRRPTIALKADPSGKTSTIFRLQQSSLTLIGADLICEQNLPHITLGAIFHSPSSTVALRDCTLTVRNQHDLFPIFLCDTPEPTQTPQVLLDRVTIRAERCMLYFARAARNQFVCANTLCILRDAGVFEYLYDDLTPAPESPRGPFASEAEPEITQQLRILSSTFYSSGPFVSIEEDRNSSPLKAKWLDVDFSHSLAISITDGESPPFLTLNSTTPRREPMAALNWLDDNVALAGWSSMAYIEQDQLTLARGPASWRALWRNPSTPEWLGPGMRDVKLVTEDGFPRDPEEIATREGLVAIGCVVEVMPKPKPVDLQRGLVAARVPASGRIVSDEKPIPFSISGSDLGQYIQSNQWPDGAHLFVTGTPDKKDFLSWCEIRGKSLTIEFENNPTGPFNKSRLYSAGEKKGAPLISVIDGNLRLINAKFQVPATNRRIAPTYMIEAVRSHVELENCTLIGPDENSLGLIGLIHVVATEEQPISDPPAATLNMHNSFISTGDYPAIQVHAKGAAIAGNETILTGNKNLIEIRTAELSGRNLLSFENSTLVPGTAAIALLNDRHTDKEDGYLVCNWENCVIAPGSAGADVAIIDDPHDLARSPHLKWWEQSSAYPAPPLKFVRGGSAITSEADWTKRWGTERSHELITGTGSVELSSNRPTAPSKQSATDFLLNRGSRASQAGRNQQSLGAHPEQWDGAGATTLPTPDSASESPSSESATSSTKPKDRPTQPDF
ncbi:serine/threonine-protein kinase [Calycomorphotria hydatis]|uniref:non-specific serine/threonine protein kinase n=1 Tax=Calycomorphotria hydatis TaxID=2528027 RepID=A0A517TDE4_9PLAN|nr:serine/threonine-protein kinase [Calycomorphotria hydatis]QDT66393.1 Serine/threonine-protein kinase StkP [Calycomorphotria hydatis]